MPHLLFLSWVEVSQRVIQSSGILVQEKEQTLRILISSNLESESMGTASLYVLIKGSLLNDEYCILPVHPLHFSQAISYRYCVQLDRRRIERMRRESFILKCYRSLNKCGMSASWTSPLSSTWKYHEFSVVLKYISKIGFFHSLWVKNIVKCKCVYCHKYD